MRDQEVKWLKEAIETVNGWEETGPPIPKPAADRMLFSASWIRCRPRFKTALLITAMAFFPLMQLSRVLSSWFSEDKTGKSQIHPEVQYDWLFQKQPSYIDID